MLVSAAIYDWLDAHIRVDGGAWTQRVHICAFARPVVHKLALLTRSLHHIVAYGVCRTAQPATHLDTERHLAVRIIHGAPAAVSHITVRYGVEVATWHS